MDYSTVNVQLVIAICDKKKEAVPSKNGFSHFFHMKLLPQ